MENSTTEYSILDIKPKGLAGNTQGIESFAVGHNTDSQYCLAINLINSLLLNLIKTLFYKRPQVFIDPGDVYHFPSFQGQICLACCLF